MLMPSAANVFRSVDIRLLNLPARFPPLAGAAFVVPLAPLAPDALPESALTRMRREWLNKTGVKMACARTMTRV